MGALTDIQDALKEAFDDEDSLGDFVASFNLIPVIVSDVRDVNTGSRTSEGSAIETRGVVSSFESSETDGTNIRGSDKKIVIIANEISQAPKINDFIEFSSGARAKIVNPNAVMSGEIDPVIYTLQVREND